MNDIDNLEREVDAFEQKTGIDFDRKMDAIEAKRVDLQRCKAGHCPTTGEHGDAPAMVGSWQ